MDTSSRTIAMLIRSADEELMAAAGSASGTALRSIVDAHEILQDALRLLSDPDVEELNFDMED